MNNEFEKCSHASDEKISDTNTAMASTFGHFKAHLVSGLMAMIAVALLKNVRGLTSPRPWTRLMSF